jgi:hypothetical protein
MVAASLDVTMQVPTDDAAVFPRLVPGTSERSGRCRRRSPRVRATRPMKLLDPVSGRYFAGRTSDVSETGLRISLPAKVPARAGSMAFAYVDNSRRAGLVGDSAMQPIRFVWVRRAADGSCTCGVRLLAQDMPQRQAA